MTNLKVDRDRLRAAAATASLAKFERRAAQAKALFGRCGVDRAVDEMTYRFCNRHLGDPDLVDAARKNLPLLKAFLTKRNATDEEARVITGTLLERDAFPRSAKSQKQLSDRNYDAYRIECGGADAAAPGIANNGRFWNETRAESPFYGNRGFDQGAHLELPAVRAGAKLGASESLPAKSRRACTVGGAGQPARGQQSDASL